MTLSDPTKKGLRRWLPNSLMTRMLLLTLLAVGLAQGLSSAIWVGTFRAHEMEGLMNSTRNLAYSVAATVRFFTSLPHQYRDIVLDQLRNMGGSRFFVSLNDHEIVMKPLPDSERKQLVLGEIRQVLDQRLGRRHELKVEFVSPENVRILNSQIPLSGLPHSWARYALTLEPINPPVLVTQIRIGKNEWFYLAAMLPAPYVSLEDQTLPRQQIVFIAVMTLILLPFIVLLVRRQTRPLKELALAASELPLNEHKPPLTEQGSSEIVAVTRAFNLMRTRIQRYLSDREQLFSAISHDLKTPITRLRLRTELLEDDQMRAKFEQDLGELELLVKGALQCMKDTDIHENVEPIDIYQLLSHITEPYRGEAAQVSLAGHALKPYRGKPLAMKRCLGNLLDNAVKYGESVTITIQDSPDQLTLVFDDRGPGIPHQQLEQIFDPFYRLAPQKEGFGLGLGIARDIARAHGGELTLSNRPEGGLRMLLELPRQP
ncbi:ATP-binding protein [Mangrovitalea sediminis]|uniref:ATP-binding protein n=1 Tax=Mangrovitalea sediminis TaxID=1982043 RepID=UPI000BE54340|nr:ATP-binding protein [Mangrovitalea sediminis]